MENLLEHNEVRRAVYTTLFGGYEKLMPQPALASSSIDAFCFTDDPDLQSGEWTVIQVSRRLPGDVVRSQRAVKVRFYDHLADYDEILYLDNTVQLKVAPEQILDVWLSGADLTLIEHSFRERLIDEFDEVARLHYDDAVRLHEQLWDYSRTTPGVLARKPLWTGLMARRNTPEVVAVMETWFEHILRYSRRDQLSILPALDQASVDVRTLTRENAESEWHTWALGPTRKVAQGKRPPLPTGPEIADLLRISSQLEASQEELRSLREERDALASGIYTELDSVLAENRNLRNHVGNLEAQILELLNSASWRLTSPLRKVVGAVRGDR